MTSCYLCDRFIRESLSVQSLQNKVSKYAWHGVGRVSLNLPA